VATFYMYLYIVLVYVYIITVILILDMFLMFLFFWYIQKKYVHHSCASDIYIYAFIEVALDLFNLLVFFFSDR